MKGVLPSKKCRDSDSGTCVVGVVDYTGKQANGNHNKNCDTDNNNGNGNNDGNDDAAACKIVEERKRAQRNQRRRSSIEILPQNVVDQIAAGEVVQRPVSVVKELIENSLDAEATHIVVQFDGLKKMTITDNGKGVPKSDLPLLCTRHATSKISSIDDFSTLDTFGFRGEALASTSMVSRLLTVISRVRAINNNDKGKDKDGLAYSQTYRNGKATSKAKPCAFNFGTKITVEDLFHNVPHRQRAFSKKEHEEYMKIHKVVQDYAIHYPTVGFVCQRATATKGKRKIAATTIVVDCNTSQIPAVKNLLQSRNLVASVSHDHMLKKNCKEKEMIMEATKQVLSHVLESNVANNLLYMECTQDPEYSYKPSHSASPPSSFLYKFTFTAQIYFTSPSYNDVKKHGSNSGKNKSVASGKYSQGKFIIFLNHRLVDIPPLKRALEDVYSDFESTNKKSKPVLVVNLEVPGSQVDVNVHPSKKQVALMFQEDLIMAISQKLRQRLEEHGQSFVAQSVVIRNPHAEERNKMKRKRTSSIQNSNESDPKCNHSNDIDKDALENISSAQISVSDRNKNSMTKKSKTSTKKLAPSKMIRTNSAARAGAIEPFLISTQRVAANRDKTSQTWNRSVLHVSTCPLSKPKSNFDLSQPGAFANVLKQEKCTCPIDENRRTVLVKSPVIRPKRVVPTKCNYASIASLRKRVGKQQCSETTQQIRTAFFMGVLSNQRSLIQAGEHLIMINHFELAKELFYQLALARFGSGSNAHLGGGIHIQSVIAQALQFEDELLQCDDESGISTCSFNVGTSQMRRSAMLEVNDTNNNLAKQATSRLVESADMLEEYFSIRIEIRECQSEGEGTNTNGSGAANAFITSLPMLLDGHQPQQYALPIFLLRLATQVDWTREKHCFHEIFKEIGNFYAMQPCQSSELNSYVQHNLFPALSYLLLPSKSQVKNGYFSNITKLSTLYKVFERC